MYVKLFIRNVHIYFWLINGLMGIQYICGVVWFVAYIMVCSIYYGLRLWLWNKFEYFPSNIYYRLGSKNINLKKKTSAKTYYSSRVYGCCLYIAGMFANNLKNKWSRVFVSAFYIYRKSRIVVRSFCVLYFTFGGNHYFRI